MTPPHSRLSVALGDRYRIERELGQGGMATVYLATDLKHEREVALKVLKPELAAVLGAERVLAEVKITARLHHPHILTLIDSGEADGQLYYVLPYVRGDSLRARLNQEKQLGIDEALRITRQIASALDYAHQQGVIHRDIKPEKILFHEGQAMLADFGIALAVFTGTPRIVLSGQDLGTSRQFTLSSDGSVLSLEAGPRLQRVVALTRTDPTSVRFSMRILVSSTANLQASIPPRGNRLAVVSQIAAGERARFRLSLIPFDSGPETVVVPQAEQIVDWVWTGVNGGRLIYGLRTGQENIRYSAFDAGTGQSRAVHDAERPRARRLRAASEWQARLLGRPRPQGSHRHGRGSSRAGLRASFGVRTRGADANHPESPPDPPDGLGQK